MEGQRLVYQFKDMPKNIVIIDDDKAELPGAEELIGSDMAAPYERVPPPSDMLLQNAELSASKKPNILRGANKANVIHTPAAAGTKPAAALTAGRIVAVSAAPDGGQNQQSHAALIPNATGPR